MKFGVVSWWARFRVFTVKEKLITLARKPMTQDRLQKAMEAATRRPARHAFPREGINVTKSHAGKPDAAREDNVVVVEKSVQGMAKPEIINALPARKLYVASKKINFAKGAFFQDDVSAARVTGHHFKLKCTSGRTKKKSASANIKGTIRATERLPPTIPLTCGLSAERLSIEKIPIRLKAARTGCHTYCGAV